MKIELPNKLRPFLKPARNKIAYGGRGSAKSWTIARILILFAVQKKVRILCTRQLQNSINDSVHKLLKEQIDSMGLTSYFTVTKQSITAKNGSEFIFKGIMHNVAEIKSLEGIDYCWIEEAEQLTENSWHIITPTIRKDDSEVWASFNTRFKYDFLYKEFVTGPTPPDSIVIKMNYNDNPWFPGVLKAQMEHMKETDFDKYLHIWLGQLKRIEEGAIFGKQMTRARKEERMLNMPIQSNCQVDIYADLGKSDETAYWYVQRVGKEVRLIDYFEDTGAEVEDYVKEIKSHGYNLGTLYLPHDAGHERIGMKRNISQQFKDGGIYNVKIVDRIPHKQTAIEMGREIMSQCYFHTGTDERGLRVEQGLDHLSAYKYKLNEANGVYQLNPLHDKHSNGADAFMAIAQAGVLQSHDKYSDWSVPINV